MNIEKQPVAVAVENPVIRGFYPDPSVCEAEGKYYLVTSSFEYFPAIPLFESSDLVHWKQIGHCLTRKEQLDLRGVAASGGIYAPTIRYNAKSKRFYVVVTNVSGNFGNFYVWTDDIHSSEWSDPVKVERGGIDPSLLFDGDKTYFISNGEDDEGKKGVSLCEIDIDTGKKLSKAKCISTGCGGRYLEAPHVYHIGDWYYLMVAEGGTEYGHMECLLRSRDIWGEYEKCPHNPILTNRNLGGYIVQGAGHGDLVQRSDGQWFMLHLAFRQIDQWLTFHNLGRETYLEPVFPTEDGWFKVGADGTARSAWRIENGECKILAEPVYGVQKWSFDEKRAVFLRLPDYADYSFEKNRAVLIGRENLGSTGLVTFAGMRQEEHCAKMEVKISEVTEGTEAGITAYLTENDFYCVCVRNEGGKKSVSARLVIGSHVVHGKEIDVSQEKSSVLKIESNAMWYTLSVKDGDEYIELIKGQTKFLSSEVACGFTGVILALYAAAGTACFSRGRACFSRGTASFEW